MGRGIHSILQVSPTVRSDCAGNFGLWVWEGIYCPTPMSYTQSDLSLAQPLDYTGICKFVFMYIRVNVRGCAGTIEGFLQFPLPNFPRMTWVDPRQGLNQGPDLAVLTMTFSDRTTEVEFCWIGPVMSRVGERERKKNEDLTD